MSEESHIVKILEIGKLTPDVKRYVVEKPEGYTFEPGQATEVCIHDAKWKEEPRPFTFTNLPEDDHLEFSIKSYFDHDGVTKALDGLKAGDELIIGDSWGAISYHGPGWFIAGGAGVTPFIAIFRKLAKEGRLEDNHLIFSNKTSKDVILEKQWKEWLGTHFISTLTQENAEGHHNKRVDADFLKEQISDFGVHFYICGPDAMVKDVSKHLEDLGAGAEGIVFEK